MTDVANALTTTSKAATTSPYLHFNVASIACTGSRVNHQVRQSNHTSVLKSKATLQVLFETRYFLTMFTSAGQCNDASAEARRVSSSPEVKVTGFLFNTYPHLLAVV